MFKKKNSNEVAPVKEVKLQSKKKKKVIRRVIIGAVVLAVLGILIVPKAFAPEVLPTVTTEKAYTGDIKQELSTSGFVESEETKTYYSDVSAKITEFNVEKGSNIHSGDSLVTYDVSALENQYKQQELQTTASKADYAQTLSDSGENATKYKNASTDVNVLEQQVEDQQNYVESLQIGLNDEANFYANVKSDLAEYQAQAAEYAKALEAATTDEAKADLNAKIEKINKKINGVEEKASNSENYTTDLNNKLIGAQNELATLQGNLSEQKSIKSSSEQGVLSGNEKTAKQATTQVTELTLEQAQQNLEEAKAGITAEFNGIITDVQVAKGATVAEGAPLFTVASNEDVKLTVALSKYDLENVKEGQSANITLGASTYTGTVSKISRVATTNSAGAAVINAEIHIDNADDNIYLGVEAKVKINVGEATGVILVPVECVNTDKEGEFCYVVEDGVLVKKAVKTGLTSDEFIEVKEGISDGEEVVSEITTDISEGMKVTTISDKATSTDAADTKTEPQD